MTSTLRLKGDRKIIVDNIDPNTSNRDAEVRGIESEFVSDYTTC